MNHTKNPRYHCEECGHVRYRHGRDNGPCVVTIKGMTGDRSKCFCEAYR